MNYQENKNQVLSAIIARLKSLPDGSQECTAKLFHDIFPEEPMPEFKELCDLDDALHTQAEKAGLYLDGIRNFDMAEGLSFNLDFIVTPLKPVISFNIVKYTESTWPGFSEELTIDLRKKTIVYAASDSDDLEHPSSRKCTAREWDKIANLVAGCRFDQWEEDYFELVLDGTSWSIDLLKDGKVVKVSSGSNGYPNCWQMFTALKDYCRSLVRNAN